MRLRGNDHPGSTRPIWRGVLFSTKGERMPNQNSDSIFKHKKVLKSGYIPDCLPNRMNEVKAISQLIHDYLEGETTHVLLSGPPGTGKTAAIKYIFKSLTDKTDALLCYVNCFNTNTRTGVIHSMAVDFFKRKRPTRQMPSRRGLGYDELLSLFKEEVEKTKTRVVVCLDEVDKLENFEIIYDLTRTSWDHGRMQLIAISNDPFVFNNLDGRIASSLFPLEEIYFSPYTRDEMLEIIKIMGENAFSDGVLEKEAIEFLAKYTVGKNGDVRIARKTLLKAGKMAQNLGDGKVEKKHSMSKLNRTQYAKIISVLSELSKQEKFILSLIPKKGTYYPQLYQFYKSTDGSLSDRTLRNYMEKFRRLKLVNMDRKMDRTFFITLNAPKEVLFEAAN
jgi:cell division control protein 6